jgi:hypothetical protein
MSGWLHAPAALPPGRACGTHWIGGWVDPRAGLDDMEKFKFLTLPGLEPRHLSRPARSQSLYRLRYPGSHSYYYYYYYYYSYFTHIHYSYVYALNWTFYVVDYSLFKFISALNSVPLFWKLLVFKFLLGTSEIYLCLLPPIPGENIILLLDAFQQIMLFVRVGMYLEPKLSLWIIFYNGPFLVRKKLNIFNTNIYTFLPA